MNLLRLSLWRACVGAGLVATWPACSNDSVNGFPTPSSVAVSAGNTQVGPAGQTLATPLSVIVRDASGNPVFDFTVSWAAVTGGGSVNPTASLTNAAGIASTTRTLGAGAGAHTTTATVTGLAPVTFNAVAQIQGATQMAVNAGNNQSDTVLTTLAVPLAVVVEDQNNAFVQGVVVNWTATGGGSVSAPTSTTNASGVATITRTFGATAGAQGAQASVTGLIGSPVSFTLTSTAGIATTLVKTAGDGGNVPALANTNYTVAVRDAHGNGVNGVTVNWAVATGGGSINPPSNTTSGNGSATATHTLGLSSPNQTATAAAPSLPGAPSVTFTTIAVATVVVGGPATAFNPNSVTIPLNGPVKFLWAAGNTLPHNVTFAVMVGAPANIPDRVAGEQNLGPFSVAGTFTYQCTNHVGMTGQVVVTP